MLDWETQIDWNYGSINKTAVKEIRLDTIRADFNLRLINSTAI